jgi:hypothetical protein
MAETNDRNMIYIYMHDIQSAVFAVKVKTYVILLR